MGTQAHSRFAIDNWQDETYDDAQGVKLARARLSKAFQGDLQGTSTVEILSATTEAGPAAYVGFERIVCSLHGRSGSFVLQHCANDPSAGQAEVTVVSGSGSGELRGLRGTGAIVRHPDGSHTFVLDYELAS
jgi:hypothetical protein